MSLQDFLVRGRLVHLQVREVLAAGSNHTEETTACGVILLVFLQVLSQFLDLLCEKSDLDLRRACVLVVKLVLGDELLLVRVLESHKRMGMGRQKAWRRAAGRKYRYGSQDSQILLSKVVLASGRAITLW